MKQNVKFLQIIVLFFLLTAEYTGYAQLDTIHWVPPVSSVHMNNLSCHLYISTPEPVPFNVTLESGNGTTLANLTVSSGTPVRYDFPSGFNRLVLDSMSVGFIVSDAGVIAHGSKAFYLNMKIEATDQAASLTSKGRTAKGKEFYWMGCPILSSPNNTDRKNGFISIMGTENNTSVKIVGYDTACEYRQGANRGGITSDSVEFNLNEGEVFILEALAGQSVINADGWLGSRIVSDKPVVINSGNMLGGVNTSPNAGISADFIIDQLVPTEVLGTEYVAVAGNGTLSSEFIIVVATEDNTEIFINDNLVPLNTINKGEYLQIDRSYYSISDNIYVNSSNPIYVFQVLSGTTNPNSIGGNILPPLGCNLPLKVGVIDDINYIGSTVFLGGGITIVTKPSASILINGLPPSSPAQTILGTSDWIVYFESGISGFIDIVSDQSMAIGYFGANGNAGYGAYFSGFSSKSTISIPNGNLNIAGDMYCLDGLQLQITDTIDGANYEWYLNSMTISGANSITHTPTQPGTYSFGLILPSCIEVSQEVNVIDCTVLPIDLLNFNVYISEERQVEIIWKTSSEFNNSHFRIYRSRDLETWQLIDSIAAAGNSNHILSYSTFDKAPYFGFNYYRLAQVDFNGDIEFSNIEQVFFQNEPEIEVHPNPTSGILKIIGLVDEFSAFSLFDMSGKLIRSGIINNDNIIQTELDLNELSPGLYSLRINNQYIKVFKL